MIKRTEICINMAAYSENVGIYIYRMYIMSTTTGIYISICTVIIVKNTIYINCGRIRVSEYL